MILVTGATGHVGSVVVATLAGQERPVRALVRRHTPGPDGAEVAVGDFNDPATL
ncbi:MAG: NAD-dependent epimerase/dehydratase family protein, partial [Alphaproteobacteria bacterium]